MADQIEGFSLLVHTTSMPEVSTMVKYLEVFNLSLKNQTVVYLFERK